MKKSATLLTVSMLVLGLFVFASPPATAQGSAPQWTAGDYWEYAGEGVLDNQPYNAVLNLNVIGKESVAVGSGSNETYHCSFNGRVIFGGSVINHKGDTYLRTSDLAIVRVLTNITTSSWTSSWDYRYDPPLEEFHFPLYSGQWWRQYVREANYGWTYFWSFNVSGPETVSVPAGTFSAFVVNGSEQPGTLSRDYYSDSVGFLVRTRGLFIGSPMPVDMDLQSYGHRKNDSSSLLIAVTVVVIAVVAVMLTAFIITVRRSRAPRVPPMPPPYQPPTQPPRT